LEWHIIVGFPTAIHTNIMTVQYTPLYSYKLRLTYRLIDVHLVDKHQQQVTIFRANNSFKQELKF